MDFWKAGYRPQQQPLPFACWHYGETCRDFYHDDTTGFYGRCAHCGNVYDPGCDR